MIRFALFCVLLTLIGGVVFAEQPPAVVIDQATVVGQEGFIRVGKSTGGFWWMIDAQGKPFFYKGVAGINRAGTEGGRRAKPGPYADAVDKKYNYATSPQPFVKEEVARLQQWGFNGMGAWTTSEFFDQGLPYTEVIENYRVGPALADIGPEPDVEGGSRMSLPDVYDPEWARHVDAKAKLLCTPLRESKQLVGYFTDNEIGFPSLIGQEQSIDLQAITVPCTDMRPSLLQLCLTADTARPAYVAAWDFVRKRHAGGDAAIAAAWGVKFTSPKELAELMRTMTVVSPGYRADDDVFIREFAGRYFRISAEAIRKYDPNHLILGCRFGGPPSFIVLEEQAKYTDIITANNYQDDMYERMNQYYLHTQKPILVGEFAWTMDVFYRSGLPVEPPRGFNSILRMKAKGAMTLEHAFQHPGIVGYTWYRWVKPTNDARSLGLVDFNDDPNTALLELLSPVNRSAEPLRIAAEAARNETTPLNGTALVTIRGCRPGGGAVMTNYNKMSLAAICRAGVWEKKLPSSYPGGEITQVTTNGLQTTMTLHLVYPPDRNGDRLSGDLTCHLTRRGNMLEGPCSGVMGGKTVLGQATVWVGALDNLPSAPFSARNRGAVVGI
ncbi:MAG: hypothetical protein WCJ56_03075 [bacterium]